MSDSQKSDPRTTDVERTLPARPRCVWRPETDCLPECEYGLRGPCVAEERERMTDSNPKPQTTQIGRP
jgi:hypothetical protein